MNNRMTAVLLAALATRAVASPDNPIDPARGYTAIPLQFPASGDVFPQGLNNLGDACGHRLTPDRSRTLAWTWTDGVFTELGSPADQPSAFAFDINDLRLVVGETRPLSGPDRFGAWWNSLGDHNATSTPEAYPFAVADDPLSRFAGTDVSGGFAVPATFLFGNESLLQLPPGREAGAAFGLNDNGDVCGWVSSADATGFSAALWTAGGGFAFAPAPGDYSFAHDVSDTDNVVGFYRVGDGSSVTQSRGFFWTPGVGFRTLPPPPIEEWSVANAVAPNGVAVGVASTGQFGVQQGTAWDTASVFDLNDLTPARNDLEIGAARAINAAGEILADARLPGTPRIGALLYPRNGRVEYSPVFPAAATAVAPRAVAHADFDDDGNTDLVVTTGGSAVQVFLGDGSGGLGPPLSVAAAFPPNDVDTADFNGDGAVDLLVGMTEGLGIAIGDGSGGFAPASGDFFFPLPEVTRAKVIDFNGDPHPDAVATRFFADDVRFLRGTPSGRLIPEFARPTGAGPVELAVADLNGDGQDDVAVANRFDGVTVIASLPNGEYDASPEQIDAGEARGQIAAADMNGDGRTDLVTLGGDGLAVAVNRNNAGFFLTRPYPSVGAFGSNPEGLALADMDLDGDADVVAASRGATGDVRTVYNRGSGVPVDTLTISPLPGLNDLREIATPDMNNDGTPDLVIVDNEDGRLLVVLNDATPPADLPAGCNPADLGAPFGVLDLTDINVFVIGFVNQLPLADLEPDGVFDLADIGVFISAFVAGCP